MGVHRTCGRANRDELTAMHELLDGPRPDSYFFADAGGDELEADDLGVTPVCSLRPTSNYAALTG